MGLTSGWSPSQRYVEAAVQTPLLSVVRAQAKLEQSANLAPTSLLVAWL